MHETQQLWEATYTPVQLLNTCTHATMEKSNTQQQTRTQIDRYVLIERAPWREKANELN